MAWVRAHWGLLVIVAWIVFTAALAVWVIGGQVSNVLDSMPAQL